MPQEFRETPLQVGTAATSGLSILVRRFESQLTVVSASDGSVPAGVALADVGLLGAAPFSALLLRERRDLEWASAEGMFWQALGVGGDAYAVTVLDTNDENTSQSTLIRRAATEWVATIDNLKDGLALVAAGTLVRCNVAFAKRFGLDVRSARGRSLDDTLKTVLPDFTALHEGARVLRTRHGDALELSVTSTPSLPGSCTVTVRDVSDALRAERLAEALSLLENSGLMIAGIRHELTNPVTVLSVGLEALATLEGPARASMVGRLREALDRMEFILRGLRSFQAGESFEIQPVSLRRSVHEVWRLSSVVAQQRAIRLIDDVGDDAWAFADPRAVFQVLLNVVSNACRAMSGPSTRERTLRVSASRTGDELVLEVSDTGPGMSERQQALLFRPFETSHSTGTGLGLFVVKRLVEGMGGRVAARSTPNQGSTFFIHLPAAPGGAA